VTVAEARRDSDVIALSRLSPLLETAGYSLIDRHGFALEYVARFGANRLHGVKSQSSPHRCADSRSHEHCRNGQPVEMEPDLSFVFRGWPGYLRSTSGRRR